MFKYFAMIMGVFIMAGAAGSSDLDPLVPLWQSMLLSGMGLLLFICGVAVAVEEQRF